MLRPSDWLRFWPELVSPPQGEHASASDVREAPADRAQAADAERRNVEQARLLKRALIRRDGPVANREPKQGKGGRNA